MLAVAVPKRNKLQNIIVLTPKDGHTAGYNGNCGSTYSGVFKSALGKFTEFLLHLCVSYYNIEAMIKTEVAGID